MSIFSSYWSQWDLQVYSTSQDLTLRQQNGNNFGQLILLEIASP